MRGRVHRVARVQQLCSSARLVQRARAAPVVAASRRMLSTRSAAAVLLGIVSAPGTASAWNTMTINSATPIATNQTLSADTSLLFTSGGHFIVAAGATLTIEGSLESAPLQKIFDGPGTVLLGTRIPRVHPEWWGASAAPVLPGSIRRGALLLSQEKPGSVAANPAVGDSAAIQSAVDSLMFGGEVVFAPGQYALGSTGLVIGSFVRLTGAGAGASRLHFSGAASRRRDCHFAAPPSTFSGCINRDGERASAKWQSRQWLGATGSAITLKPDTEWFHLQHLSLRGDRVDGYGINGSAHYVRYFNVRDFAVRGHHKTLQSHVPPPSPQRPS